MPVDFDRPAKHRLTSLSVVAALHIGVVFLLLSQSETTRFLLPQALQAVQILPVAKPPPPPPPAMPVLTPPELAPMPAPEVTVAEPRSPVVPHAIVRVLPHAAAVSHFGPAADDAGLGVEAATTNGGGASGRFGLGYFEAAVKHAVLGRKRQPSLAWDRRNTCVVNYTVSVARDGSLAGLHIDPCAVPEINAAAEAAIRAAAPFPPPPDLGAARTDVHGSLVFHP